MILDIAITMDNNAAPAIVFVALIFGGAFTMWAMAKYVWSKP